MSVEPLPWNGACMLGSRLSPLELSRACVVLDDKEVTFSATVGQHDNTFPPLLAGASLKKEMGLTPFG